MMSWVINRIIEIWHFPTRVLIITHGEEWVCCCCWRVFDGNITAVYVRIKDKSRSDPTVRHSSDQSCGYTKTSMMMILCTSNIIADWLLTNMHGKGAIYSTPQIHIKYSRYDQVSLVHNSRINHFYRFLSFSFSPHNMSKRDFIEMFSSFKWKNCGFFVDWMRRSCCHTYDLLLKFNINSHGYKIIVICSCFCLLMMRWDYNPRNCCCCCCSLNFSLTRDSLLYCSQSASARQPIHPDEVTQTRQG